MFLCFVIFPCGVAGQVLHVIVSISDLCIPLYLELGSIEGRVQRKYPELH